jgi:hypothetical protein
MPSKAKISEAKLGGSACLSHRTPDSQSTRKAEGQQLKAVLQKSGFSG